MFADEYTERLVDSQLDELLAGVPAVFVTGPRAVGKTTTALRRAASVVRLDDPGIAATWAAAPDALLARQAEPVVLDEWQYVPQVIGALKRSIDSHSSPGRFIVTGSATAVDTPALWPGAGRLVRVPMWGLTQRELLGRQVPGLLDRLRRGGDWAARVSQRPVTLPDYVHLALRGQFPAAVALPPGLRRSWADSYLGDVVSRDIPLAAGSRDPLLVRRYLQACAELSSTATTTERYLDLTGLSRSTAAAYESALRAVGVIDVLPAWHDSRLKRLTRMPRRFVVDTALMASLLRVGADDVLADDRLLGRLLETFVLAQLRPEASATSPPVELYHLRAEQGRREVDLVVDLGGRRVAGLEIKATGSPTARDARHLAWLRDELGERFVTGAVLHCGPGLFPLGERLWALPLSVLWRDD